MARVWKSLGVGAAAAVVAAVAVAGHNAVDNTITGEDRGHIEAFLQSAQVAPPRAPRSYEAEIAFIADVQRAVLDKVSGHEPIDFDLFCSGHTFLGDGRPITVGGQDHTLGHIFGQHKTIPRKPPPSR